jgi:hypothetical protein
MVPRGIGKIVSHTRVGMSGFMRYLEGTMSYKSLPASRNDAVFSLGARSRTGLKSGEQPLSTGSIFTHFFPGVAIYPCSRDNR